MNPTIHEVARRNGMSWRDTLKLARDLGVEVKNGRLLIPSNPLVGVRQLLRGQALRFRLGARASVRPFVVPWDAEVGQRVVVLDHPRRVELLGKEGDVTEIDKTYIEVALVRHGRLLFLPSELGPARC